MLILDEKLSEEKWNDIVAHIIRSCSLSEIHEVYSAVISDGNLPLIKIFAENGVDAFQKAKPEKNEFSAAPIFSLIGQNSDGISLDPKDFFKPPRWCSILRKESLYFGFKVIQPKISFFFFHLNT